VRVTFLRRFRRRRVPEEPRIYGFDASSPSTEDAPIEPPAAPDRDAVGDAPAPAATDDVSYQPPTTSADPPVNASDQGPGVTDEPAPPERLDLSPPPKVDVESTRLSIAQGTVRGILRWLLTETEAEGVAFLQVAPGQHERLYLEPRGLLPATVAGLAVRARRALVGGNGDTASTEGASSRWLGEGGPKVLVLAGVSPIRAAEPVLFARFVLEWLAASTAGEPALDVEERARSIDGVAWAEPTEGGGLRLLAAEDADPIALDTVVAQALPGVRVEWAVEPPPSPPREKRARLVDVSVLEDDLAPSAEVRLQWEGNELRGLGRAPTSLVGRHLAAARGTLDALKPLVHGDVDVEHVQVLALGPDLELLQVTVLVGQERLVGAVMVRPDDEHRSGAKAVLDALNRRLTMIAGQSGPL
jgi:hypothetical protein